MLDNALTLGKERANVYSICFYLPPKFITVLIDF